MSLAILPALIAAAAAASPAATASETVIPFVSSQGILDWQAAGEDRLYVRGYDGRWYFVRTMGPCPRLKDALTLGFATSALGQLDRHGAILAQGSRCPVDSVTRAAAPPPGKKGRR